MFYIVTFKEEGKPPHSLAYRTASMAYNAAVKDSRDEEAGDGNLWNIVLKHVVLKNIDSVKSFKVAYETGGRNRQNYITVEAVWPSDVPAGDEVEV